MSPGQESKATIVRSAQYPSQMHFASPSRGVRPFPRPRMSVLRTTLCLLVVPLVACDQSRLTWADDAPQRTTMPSPLAHPPFVPYDSSLRDTSELASYLWTQDRLREAGAQSLLAGLADSMPEAADPLAVTKPVAMAGMDHSAHMAAGASMVTAPDTSGLASDELPRDANRCARSLRVADAAGHGRVAVWWTRVASGRVHLVAAWRDGDGQSGAWRGPIPVDTLDQGPEDAQAGERGVHGCVRPAPSLVWDARTAFVHVGYAVRGPEGPGIFYAHQMDPRAAFEVPVAVIYGEQLGAVRVASDGDVVAVTYEDPNTRGRPRVGLAVSRTAGHSFEEQRFIASADAGEARDPHVVVKGRAVVVGWSDVAKPPTAPTDRTAADPVFVTRRLRVAR